MSRYDAVTQAVIDYLSSPGWGRQGRAAETLERVVEAKHPGALERARVRTKKAAVEARFEGNPPEWAKRWVMKYAMPGTKMRWRRSRTKTLPTGRCYNGERIVVTAAFGEPGDYERTVVLHEIAHTLAPWDSHGERFYDKYFKLLVVEHLYREALLQPYPETRGLKAAARRARANRKVA